MSEWTDNETNIRFSTTVKGSPDYATTRWEENMAKIAEKERELEILKAEMASNRWNITKMSPTTKIVNQEQKYEVERETLEDFKLVEK